MRYMMRWPPILPIATAAICVVVALAHSSANADANEWPVLHEGEAPTSAFWEGIANKTSSRYMQLVTTGFGLIETTPRSALDHLRQAQDLYPDKPDAIFGLGLIAQREHRYDDCRILLEKVSRLSPAFEWPGRKRPFHLDYGMCLRRSGHHEQAVRALKRVLDGEAKPAPIVYKELGDAYMAMELLDLAIRMYEQPKRRGVPRWIFAYAMALDRSGAFGRAKKARRVATEWDPQLTGLTSSERYFYPKEDRDYALGLGFLQKKQPERSTFHFASFINQSTSKLYRRQAQRHIDAQTDSDHTLSIAGANAWTDEQWRRERETLEDGFQQCLRHAPSWFSEISITRRKTGELKSISDPSEGIAIVPLPQLTTRQDTPPKLLSCLTLVAESFDFAPILGRFIRVTFVVSKAPKTR